MPWQPERFYSRNSTMWRDSILYIGAAWSTFANTGNGKSTLNCSNSECSWKIRLTGAVLPWIYVSNKYLSNLWYVSHQTQMQYCSYTIANLDWYEFGVFMNRVTCLKSCWNLNVIQSMRLKLLRSLALTISRSLPIGMAGIHLDVPKRRREIGWNMTHDTPEMMIVKCNLQKLSWITTPNKSCPVSQPSNCCSQNLWSSLRSALAWLRIKSIAANNAIVLADVVFREGYSTVNLMSHDEVPSISLHQANPATYLQDSEVSEAFDAWFP